jgi:hypothetical protein
MNDALFTKETLNKAIHAALRHWGELGGAAHNLLENLRLAQQERAKMAGDTPATRRLAANQVLLNGLQALKRQDPEGETLLSRRFLDGDTHLMVAARLNLSPDQMKRRQRAALNQLTELIWERETAVRQQQIAALEADLTPVNYDQLFGVTEQLTELVNLLRTNTAPWIVALVGIGGIGKTALANEAARQLIPHFIYERVVWLRLETFDGETAGRDALLRQLTARLAPQANYAQLRQRLKETAHLIILDNLESGAEMTAVADLLPELANPSKFLLTSRVRPPAAALIRSVAAPQMTETAVAELIAHQAGYLNLPALTRPSAENTAQIYALTGGNPLAVKLVIGLAAVLPLTQILTDMTAAQISDVAQMYRHIYWQAWRALSDNGRALLKMMPLAAGSGITPEQMAAMSQLGEAHLWSAIAELTNRSLLETQGTAWERRYLIHPLTNSFLRADIIHWPDPSQ